jgi:hypothetical protein
MSDDIKVVDFRLSRRAGRQVKPPEISTTQEAWDARAGFLADLIEQLHERTKVLWSRVPPGRVEYHPYEGSPMCREFTALLRKDKRWHELAYTLHTELAPMDEISAAFQERERPKKRG